MATALEPPAIGPESAGIAIRPDEFDALSDFIEGYRYELVRGVLVVTPIPSEREAYPNEWLGGLLFVYKEQHPRGASLDLTLPERYIVTEDSRRRADRVLWAGLGRRPDPRVDLPTIAVEFVSGGKRNWTRDYVAKRDEYLALGIVEYWVIDRFRRIMTVFRQIPGGFSELVVSEGESYQTPLLPGFELPLDRLFEASDGWPAP